MDLERRKKPVFSNRLILIACIITSILGIIGIVFTALDFIRIKQ